MSVRPVWNDSEPSDIARIANQNFRLIDNRLKKLTYKDETGTRRVMLGKGEEGFYGLKVSKPEFDVYTATNDQLVFNSNQNTFKIVDTVVVTLIVPIFQTDVVVDYTHNLGYIPSYLAFADSKGNGYSAPLPFFGIITGIGSGTALSFQEIVYSDATNEKIFFYFQSSQGQGVVKSYNIRLYILQETAEVQ